MLCEESDRAQGNFGTAAHEMRAAGDDDQLKRAMDIQLSNPSGDVTIKLAFDCFGVKK